ncbi:TPA: hypothetical protein DIC62_02290, partial [Candidatus Nomurabacteria bacterium]|nr:hypothetical protein [Candidatus Nomurabacteria bacterium]
MIKNILKKFIVLFGIGFILFGFNFTNVNAEEIFTPTPLECTAPQILNEAGDTCVDVVATPAVLVCVLPQVEVAGVCTTPAVEPTPDPVPDKLKEQVVIRNGDIILYDGFYELPESGIISIPDKDGVAHDIDARSVLAIFYGIDNTSDNFSISTLEYSGVYDSLYMKCLTP